MNCPIPDIHAVPASWPGLMVLAGTLIGEAEGEPYLGKLAVAEVIMERVRDKRWPNTVAGVCFQPFQFSCWRDQNRLATMRDPIGKSTALAWEECFKAACAAYWRYETAYTGNANHYVEEQQLRKAGQLPDWFKEEAVTLRLGHHTFLRL